MDRHPHAQRRLTIETNLGVGEVIKPAIARRPADCSISPVRCCSKQGHHAAYVRGRPLVTHASLEKNLRKNEREMPLSKIGSEQAGAYLVRR